jgi:RNA polymerase sigma-70 factor (ECF subfamily)
MVQQANQRPRLRAVAGGAAPAAPVTDEAIIAAVREGDEAVARELYARLYDVIDHSIYRVFGRRERFHDDLIQASFEQVVRTLCRHSYAGACSLRTWASALASHVALNALRSRRRERLVIDYATEMPTEGPPSQQRPDRDADSRRKVATLMTELTHLPPARAEALWLHDVLGHDLAEISLMTGVSVSAAQSRLSRGRRELAKRMAEATAEEVVP